MIVGVLAFQGDFAEHIQVLHSLRVPAIEVRSLEDLSKVSALIIPGGESTVIGKFLQESGVGKEIVRRVALRPLPRLRPAPLPSRERGASLDSAQKNSIPLHPEGGGVAPERRGGGTESLIVYGTCAGAILLAKKVTGKNAPKTLGLIDATLERNAYGTQIDSFEAELKISGIQKPVPVAFIRAPKITHVGKNVEVLAKFRGEPVLIRQGNVMIGTFHAEVRVSSEVHKLFLAMTR